MLHIFFTPQLIALSIPLLFSGWLMSIALVVVAFPLRHRRRPVLAFAKMSKLRAAALDRRRLRQRHPGTPLFLQIFIAFIGLPLAGIQRADFVTAASSCWR